MSDVAIRVEGLGKRYRIGAQQRHDTLRDSIVDAVSRLKVGRPKVDNLQPSTLQPSGRDTDFWALKDVSFEVKKGEVVGVIGRNGAGKSTLLKILSRITEPTEGRAEIHGRVGSLLEVGTGFHPELTGRENIFLNGAILGMRRTEIAARFDEIVAFSEIEKFLDTPVKRYSSGMYVRLAFAVAAHLEPEILLVDEVLAVGDAAFQRKCLGKMEDVASEGRTVLFVSHNMAAISRLCGRVCVIHQGHAVFSGETREGIATYLRQGAQPDSNLNTASREGNGLIQFRSFHCEDSAGRTTSHLATGDPARLVIVYESSTSEPRQMEISVVIHLLDGTDVTNLSTHYFFERPVEPLSHTGRAICIIDRVPLRMGTYVVDLYSSVDGEMADRLQSAATFDVTDGDYYGTGRLTRYATGSVLLDHRWQFVEGTA